MIDFIFNAYMQKGGCTMLLALMQQHSRWSIVTEAPGDEHTCCTNNEALNNNSRNLNSSPSLAWPSAAAAASTAAPAGVLLVWGGSLHSLERRHSCGLL